jgi:hypothetical protein
VLQEEKRAWTRVGKRTEESGKGKEDATAGKRTRKKDAPLGVVSEEEMGEERRGEERCVCVAQVLLECMSPRRFRGGTHVCIPFPVQASVQRRTDTDE